MMDEKDLNKTQLQIYKKEVTPLVKKAMAVQVTNQVESVHAQKFVIDIKTARNALHEKFIQPVSHARTAWESARSLYNFFIDPFDRAEKIIKHKVSRFEARQKERREEREKKILEKQKRSKAALPKPVRPEPDRMPGVSFTERWVCVTEKTDIKCVCALVVKGVFPVEAVRLNQSVLNNLADSWQKTREFPGVTFKKVTDMKARTE